MREKAINTGLFLFLFLTLLNCAKRGTPTGGEKDITPPKMISAEPDTSSINFKGKRIRIYFDEYIKLKDIQKQLIISPPMKTTPQIMPQGTAGKYVDIKIVDTLKENTTYVFNFGQSIVDNNEENPYSFFKYVFSTGDYVDSLTVNGYVTDAIQKKPDDFVSVLLYEIDSTYNDSIVYKKLPTYITNTLDSTSTFQISNIKAGKYMLIGLKDNSGTNTYAPKTDKIAFISDFIEVPTDSVYRLNLFQSNSYYRSARPVLAAKNRIIFGYEGNGDSINIDMLYPTPPPDYKYRILKDKEKDTLHYWFTGVEADSLIFQITNPPVMVRDTFTVKIKELYNDTLALSAAQKGDLSFKKPFAISSTTPITAVTKERITILNKDSVPVDFNPEIDEKENLLHLKWEVLPNENYLVTLLPEAIEDMFGEHNDTVSYALRTKSFADYGNLRITLPNADSFPLIIQLTTEKGEVKDEIYATEAREYYEFDNLNPGKYLLRVIFDENKNRKWDTGNYLDHLQPERVSHLPDVLNIKANWDMEQEFILLDPAPPVPEVPEKDSIPTGGE
ncbi:Ig-like domain-containing protein [Sinomicrobium weinanense]|uniref:Ig-like domain-containing protein n=1 Tax=Sinomicrobium weinanense TaxID=2842200 RepID=A0A926JQF2_9FLAO|nr:Ig-like domain-containing protein [Sinomicrobium weinanense]MBC9795466.1 Ig-like domain-containing protein [Sinomicrobium weinanense]MBU3123991.1 Ig-like domain-containing protein [Sinomicrobium weinanense]